MHIYLFTVLFKKTHCINNEKHNFSSSENRKGQNLNSKSLD